MPNPASCLSNQVPRRCLALARNREFHLDLLGGFLAGGGVALLYATRVLKDVQTENEDQKRGVEILENALKVNYYLSSPEST